MRAEGAASTPGLHCGCLLESRGWRGEMDGLLGLLRSRRRRRRAHRLWRGTLVGSLRWLSWWASGGLCEGLCGCFFVR
jgi:hypothetical protein